MSRMSSTKKGDILEKQFESFLRKYIKDGAFWAKDENCKVFRKKGYYSRDRDKNIIFDVSVEIYVPGQEDWSILCLFECKNLGRAVSVDDVEEFWTKADQVAAGSVKAVMVSNRSYQEGAVTFARSKKIGLIREFEGNDLVWMLTRSPSFQISDDSSSSRSLFSSLGMTDESYRSDYYDYLCQFGGHVTNSLNDFFHIMLSDGRSADEQHALSTILTDWRHPVSVVPFVSREQIGHYAKQVLDKVNYSSGRVQLGAICSQLTKRRGLRLQRSIQRRSSLDGGVLGRISFQPFEIETFTKGEEPASRERFTLAHELGHWFLRHGRYMRGELCRSKDIDRSKPVEVGIVDVSKMEWQANAFAAALLMPVENLVSHFRMLLEEFDVVDKGHGALFLDSQRCNWENFKGITSRLTRIYGVSTAAMSIRLKELGLLVEDTSNKPKRIGELF